MRFIVCTAWCAATIYALHKVTVFMAGAFPHDFELLLAAGLAGLLVAGMALAGRCGSSLTSCIGHSSITERARGGWPA